MNEIYQMKHAINALYNTAPKCIQHKCEHKMNVPNHQNKTTKQLYENYVQKKFESPIGLAFLKQIMPKENISQTYTMKVRLIKDKKSLTTNC